jgi:predicted Holliday junction resolvase-like endonuclease
MQGLLTVLVILLLGLAVVAGGVAAFFYFRYSVLQRSGAAQVAAIRKASENELATALATRSETLQKQAQEQLAQWRTQELEGARQQQLEVARGEAQNSLAQWRTEHEVAIRQDAIDRSRAVIAGKITEHFIPYLPDFAFNPKDARFIGTPIDMVVFDGLDEGDLKRVVFIEVKTGNSALSGRERKIRDAITAGKVEFQELRRSLDFKATVTPEADGSGATITVETP